jgi:hypothetical protein
MDAPKRPTADVVNIDSARRAKPPSSKVVKPTRHRATRIRISVNPAGRLSYQETHNTKQDAYTLMLGCCIMLSRMFRELGDTWGR